MRLPLPRVLRWLCAFLLAVAVGVLAPHAVAAGSSAYGINATSSVLQAPNATARRAALADIRALGGRYVRLDVTWSYVEPTAGAFNWSFYDAVMSDIAAAGLQPIMLLDYGNPAYGPTTNPADFARYARAVATRYAPKGFHVYEVWNEPNLTGLTAAQYVALLAPTYAAIHAADPAATVLSAGIGPSGMTAYVSAMYAAGAKGRFDALAIHPYVGEGAESIPAVRAAMVANGDGAKKMWATEFGWSSWVTPGNSESLQASRITQFGNYWRTVSGHGPLIIYTHRDTTAAGAEGKFGLTRIDGSRKPAWSAFAALVKAG